MKRVRYCQLPTSMTVTGRSSSITNAFFTAIIPVGPFWRRATSQRYDWAEGPVTRGSLEDHHGQCISIFA